MEELRTLLTKSFTIDFVSAVLSNPKTKEGTVKIKARPLLKQNILYVQFESFRNNQAFHENVRMDQAAELAFHYMEHFKQMSLVTKSMEATVLISKKGKVTIKKKDAAGKAAELSHNRSKKYLLPEGTKVPFLIELGVMTEEGRVVKSKFDKFRQINRFLEFIADVLPTLPKDREITILDFGCGKSYLTFAMYYYLHEMNHYDVRMIGLDLKTEVIAHCNQLSEKFGYEKLKFLEGNIADYTGEEKVDMVVTLHACDTATDFALAKAIAWQAKVILSVPCCQHELNGQMGNALLKPVFKYGLIKERIAALVTDALRAEYLQQEGYDAQILEFIDMEHTPKNILIRAVKNGNKRTDEGVKACEEFLHVTPMLGKLLDDRSEQ